MSSLKRKFIFIFLSIFVVVGLIAGYGCSSQNNSGQTSGESDKLVVYTSFYPTYFFTSQVAGDKAEVHSLVPVGVDPHEYDITTEDMKNLTKAEVLVVNGAGMEPWLDDAMSQVGDNLKVIDTSKNVNLISAKDAVTEISPDAHSSHDEHEHGVEGHEHEHGDEEHEHEHGEFDPHYWLSLRESQVLVQNIADGLSEIDPDNASYYQKNADSCIKKLKDLDAKYEKNLKNVKQDKLVTGHTAFAYICRDYNLKQVGVVGISSESEPTPQRMSQIVEYINDNNIKVIFTEEYVNPMVAETLSKETGATIEKLNPLGSLSKEDAEANLDYFSIMENNLEVLKKSLT